MKVIRTYPQPDAPQLGSNSRNRALAVFKYLLNLEPEAATKHPLFACIEHAFAVQGYACANESMGCPGGDLTSPSLIPELPPGEIVGAKVREPLNLEKHLARPPISPAAHQVFREEDSDPNRGPRS